MSGKTPLAKMCLPMPVGNLPGVSRKRAQFLRRLGVQTVSDLLRHLPVRCERESAEGQISGLQVGTIGSARGLLVATRWIAPLGRGRKGRFEATLQDASGRLVLTWFNAAYLRQVLHLGLTIRVQGPVRLYSRQIQMVNPKWEKLDQPDKTPALAERLRPVYPATEQLPSTAIEALIKDVLPRALPLVKDPLPADLLEHHAMPNLSDALRMMHQPADDQQVLAGRRRLAFNELLLLQLGIAMKRSYVRQRLAAPPLRYSAAIDEHIRRRFPFQLTGGQNEVLQEISDDLTSSRPMNRLLQGDVGAGKTVVALYALLMAVANRKQAALMAPTELLAEQHYLSISQMLAGSNVNLVLLTGGSSAAGTAQRSAVLDQIESGAADLVVGTHALLTESVRFSDLAVAVIDEQHRFGVVQRARFRSLERGRSRLDPADGKGRKESSDSGDMIDRSRPATRQRVPHHLVMTATPIPRTLSLTIFGDLDISTIRDLPPGRSPIANRFVSPDQADEVYRDLAQRIEKGEQAYVVVPTIDARGEETASQLKSVQEHVALLRSRFGLAFHVAGIHGRLKRRTRESIMDRFRRGQIQVLVATTVIEVGLDVPTATLMVIEHAERFGLASLHQLRGRIGRGSHGHRSLCVFVAEPTTDEARQRLDAIVSTTDGFKIAEMDLQIRGMGDLIGTRQHGLPPLRVAKIPEDMDLLHLARRDATTIVEKDPDLAAEDLRSLRHVLLQQYGEALGLIDVG